MANKPQPPLSYLPLMARLRPTACLVLCALMLCACAPTADNHNRSLLARWWALLTQRSNDPSADTLVHSVHEAQAWLRTQAQQAPSQSNNMGNTSLTADRRLVRTAQKNLGQVFVMVNETGKNATPASANNPTTTLNPLNSLTEPTVTADNLTLPPTIMPPAANPTTTSTLAQANADQIRFLGLIQSGDERFGLVRVGEQVYRVRLHDKIGRGHWSVISLSPNQMQLSIQSKVTTYAK